MPPKYKVSYFDIRGLGEPIRYLLSYGKADFEDIRVPHSDWPSLKPTTPFGKMPLLEVDGKVVDQSTAICSYLAKQFGIAGINDWEALQIQSVADNITDVRIEIVGFAFEADEAVKAKKKEKILKETLPFYLSKFDSLVKANKGYFVAGKLSWADLYFAALHDFLGCLIQQDLTANYSNLKSLVEKVNALPSIKAWIAKRPVTDM